MSVFSVCSLNLSTALIPSAQTLAYFYKKCLSVCALIFSGGGPHTQTRAVRMICRKHGGIFAERDSGAQP